MFRFLVLTSTIIVLLSWYFSAQPRVDLGLDHQYERLTAAQSEDRSVLHQNSRQLLLSVRESKEWQLSEGLKWSEDGRRIESDDDSGHLRYVPTQPLSREFLGRFNGLAEEGRIEVEVQDSFGQSLRFTDLEVDAADHLLSDIAQIDLHLNGDDSWELGALSFKAHEDQQPRPRFEYHWPKHDQASYQDLDQWLPVADVSDPGFDWLSLTDDDRLPMLPREHLRYYLRQLSLLFQEVEALALATDAKHLEDDYRLLKDYFPTCQLALVMQQSPLEYEWAQVNHFAKHHGLSVIWTDPTLRAKLNQAPDLNTALTDFGQVDQYYWSAFFSHQAKPMWLDEASPEVLFCQIGAVTVAKAPHSWWPQSSKQHSLEGRLCYQLDGDMQLHPLTLNRGQKRAGGWPVLVPDDERALFLFGTEGDVHNLQKTLNQKKWALVEQALANLKDQDKRQQRLVYERQIRLKKAQNKADDALAIKHQMVSELLGLQIEILP